jgi:Spy/CpxP family protein refolding chaperone
MIEAAHVNQGGANHPSTKSMKKFLIPMLAALAAVTLATPAQAVDATPGKSAADVRSGGVFGSDGPLRHALRGALRRWLAFREETPLTEQQRAQIREIVKPHRDAIRTQITAMRDAHSQLHKATTKDGDVQAAATKVGEAARNGALLRARLAREIRPVLTPEQCQRLDSGIEEFQSNLGKLGTL